MNSFAYIKPRTKEEALSVLHELGARAKIAAGCTNVLPDIKAKKLADCVLVDISSLAELKGIKVTGETITLGSLVTISELLESEAVASDAAVLWQAAKVFADPLTRNRATIGGNLANASPAGDGIVPLMALGAIVTVENVNGKREIPLEDLFTGPGQNALKPDELITAVSFARATNTKSNFIKFGLRKSMAISLVSIAVVMETNGDKLDRIRIALGALAPTPVRAKKTEELLAGKQIGPEVLEQASELIKTEVEPITDVRASREYRLHLTGVLLKRAIETALA
ncbi:MAG: xanthine dehydrogenase family protein subunit M [Clostridia bacterium]|mgnify:CR=1 FL=1|nr:xanthine dehydrogenase family protein subunit M [Clostridia bacterium]